MDKPTQEPAKELTKLSEVDIEAFAGNLARVVEEGGKALAAYMKPREEGKIKSELAEDVTDVVKTLGQVTEYWLADPQRAVELQTSLGRAYLDLWAAAVKRMAGEETKPVAAPDPKDKRFADPEWSQNQFFDFLKQAYLLTAQWADQLVKDAEGVDAHTRQKAEFYVKQIANAISPSNFVLTNPELLRETLLIERRQSGARHAHAHRGHQGRPRQSQDPPVRLRACSRSAAISRSRPAR